MTADWLFDLEERGMAGLPWYVREYVAATAGTPVQRDAVLAEWDAVRFRPRVLRGDPDLSLATTVLGRSVATPVLVAPMAQQVAAHPDGEEATARGVQRAGSLLGVSTNTGIPFDRIAATGAPWWFQLYLLADRSITSRLIERAVSAGAEALILTVDTTALSASRPGIEPLEWPVGPSSFRLANLDDADREAVLRIPTVTAALADIPALQRESGLPVVVKGVLRADDAAAAVDAGAAGVLVSTHGGRRMGGSVSSLHALAEVVAAVDGRAEVYVDSGIRSGSHVLAALALGARAVFVGRPVMWGLAADGDQGVESVIRTLGEQTRLALQQSGALGLHDLGPDLLA